MQIETIVRVIGTNNIKVNTLNHITYNDCSLNSALLDVIVPHSFSLLHRSFDFRHYQQIKLTRENRYVYMCAMHARVIESLASIKQPTYSIPSAIFARCVSSYVLQFCISPKNASSLCDCFEAKRKLK